MHRLAGSGPVTFGRLTHDVELGILESFPSCTKWWLVAAMASCLRVRYACAVWRLQQTSVPAVGIFVGTHSLNVTSWKTAVLVPPCSTPILPSSREYNRIDTMASQAASTARVEIVTNPRPIHIDRTLPSLLKPHLENNEWQSFCDEIDSSLATLNRAFQSFQCCIRTGFAISVVIVVLYIVLVQALSVLREESFFFILPVFFILIVSKFVMIYNIGKTLSQAHSSIEVACDEMSLKKPSLSFILRHSPAKVGWGGLQKGRVDNFVQATVNSHIEVVVKVDIAEVPVDDIDELQATSSGIPEVIAYTILNTTASGAEDRLEVLERIRHLLTDTEYQDKRAEILSAV